MALDLTPSLLAATTPSALTVTANVGSIVLDWTPGLLKNLQYTEVWRATTNNRASASLITTTFSDTYTDVDFVEGTDYYYWIRPKNIWNRNDAWYPTSSTGGVYVVAPVTADSVSSYAYSFSSASGGSGGTTVAASSYGSSWETAVDIATFTPAAGSSMVAFNIFELEHSIGTPSGGSDLDVIDVYFKLWLYDNTVGADVANVRFEFKIARALRLGGTWTVKKAADIINWHQLFFSGFMGTMIPGNQYKLKGAIKRERVIGSTGTMSATVYPNMAWNSSSMS